MKRGQVELVGVLDLHGYTQDRAKAALRAFLRAQQGGEAATALVITGKGGRLSAGDAAPGVLRQRLPEWLAERDLREIVSGYAPAHRRHGGGGAYYVFLRRRSR